jgi:hypothetical protein
VRAFATDNNSVTYYGNQLSFTTAEFIITTTAVTDITAFSATSGGALSTTQNIGDWGVCWSTSSNPTTADNTAYNYNFNPFTSSMSGLAPNTTYYVRAFASDYNEQTYYGNELSFTTPSFVTTTAVSQITGCTARSGGSSTISVSSSGLCWSTSINPTIANNATQDNGSPFTSYITGLTENTTYYVRAYVIYNGEVSYGNQLSFTTITLCVGQSYQGGIIAYISPSGTFGLIAAPSDQSTGAEWGCYETALSGADGTAMGTGAQNTIDIMNGCSTAGIAARLCGDLVLGGYSDWYLPSKDELNQLYLNRVAIGGFAVNYYWSSTEGDNRYAWIECFGSGTQAWYDKHSSYFSVRAVRAF